MIDWHAQKKFLFFLIIPILSGLIFCCFVLNSPQTKAVDATTSVSVASNTCGNNHVNVGEECDGSDLNGQTCEGLGFTGGTLECDVGCLFDTSQCLSETNQGGGGGTTAKPSSAQTKVILQGQAYPDAKITLLIDGILKTTADADSLGSFKIEITDITAGVYTFSLWSQDMKARKSITYSLTVTITKDMTTTVSNIILPPTIELEKISLIKGENLNISGRAVRDNQVTILIKSQQEITETALAESNGNWKYVFNTINLSQGTYFVRARAKTSEGLVSPDSEALVFYVGEEEYVPQPKICSLADFNGDEKVNLVDFSILLYWWNKYNVCMDQNKDGIVNLPDFSILMYYWTG